MVCIRIHKNIVHAYVHMYVCTCKLVNSVCNFVWQIRRQSSALSLIYSLSLITGWRERWRCCNQPCHRLLFVTWVTTAQQLSNKSIGIYFSFYSSIISQVFFLFLFFYLIHRSWISSFAFALTVAVAALSLPLLFVAAAFIDVSCAFIIHISHLILFFFLVSALHSSMCPLKQLWHTHVQAVLLLFLLLLFGQCCP